MNNSHESGSISTRHQHIKKNLNNVKVVAAQVLQSTECLGRKDRNLPVLLQLSAVAKRSNWQQLNADCRAVDTTIDSTCNTFVRHEEFVASDSMSWRPGKFSWLEMVFLECSASNQQTTKKMEDNMNQDFRKSRLSNEDLELSDQAYTLVALLCKDEACAYVRSAEDGNGYQAWQALFRARTARNATNLLNQLLEQTFTSPDPRIHLRQWNKNAEENGGAVGMACALEVCRVLLIFADLSLTRTGLS